MRTLLLFVFWAFCAHHLVVMIIAEDPSRKADDHLWKHEIQNFVAREYTGLVDREKFLNTINSEDRVFTENRLKKISNHVAKFRHRIDNVTSCLETKNHLEAKVLRLKDESREQLSSNFTLMSEQIALLNDNLRRANLLNFSHDAGAGTLDSIQLHQKLYNETNYLERKVTEIVVDYLEKINATVNWLNLLEEDILKQLIASCGDIDSDDLRRSLDGILGSTSMSDHVASIIVRETQVKTETSQKVMQINNRRIEFAEYWLNRTGEYLAPVKDFTEGKLTCWNQFVNTTNEIHTNFSQYVRDDESYAFSESRVSWGDGVTETWSEFINRVNYEIDREYRLQWARLQLNYIDCIERFLLQIITN